MKRAVATLLAAVLIGCNSTKPDPQPVQPQPEQPRGSITGKVSFPGKLPKPKRIDVSEDEECVKLNKGGLFDNSLANVFVYIKEGVKPDAAPAKPQEVVLDQKNCQFTPRLLAMRAGDTIKVTNSDPVTHNVHPVAQMNREWNQSQAPGDPPVQRRFVRPEIMIRIKCNIHNWMRSWVAVMPHPYYAVVKPDGTFTIPNVPPGDYTLEAWQEVLGTQEQKIHLDPAGTATVAFTYTK